MSGASSISTDEKEEIVDSFLKVLYSNSEDVYKLANRAHKNSAYGVMVKPPRNKVAIPLTEYFERIWEAEKEMCVQFIFAP